MPTLRRFLVPFASLVVAASLGACDPGTTDHDAGTGSGDATITGEASLEVGTGEGVFSSFEDGATLELVSGCQGLQHVWIALRSWGLDPRGTIIDLAFVRDRDSMVVSQSFRVRVSMSPVAGTDHADVAGLTLVVPEADAALMEDLTLRAVVTDMRGVEVMSERPVRITWGEGGCL
jgi:hypothetical protein